MSFLLSPYSWDLANPSSIPNLTFTHLYVSLLSVVLGLLIAFPLALLAIRFRRVYVSVLGISGFLYTIPSLALFAFLVPFTGLTLATAVIPLVLYTQVVLIRNIVAAIHGVDPSLLEVGRAMGMNGKQLQARVVLPLALPVIVAGVRVVMVTTIGIATLAPEIGVQTLGRLIFDGFSFAYNDEVIAGTILITVLALAADVLLLGVQRWLNRGRVAVAAQ